MPVALIIVESPTKARTIAGLVGDSYSVKASVGHVRDLPRSVDELPTQYRGESWARLAVDVDHGFCPVYVIPEGQKRSVRALTAALRHVDEVYLATDGDREGEAIAWHLVEVLRPKVPVRRMTFHEITAPAIQRALAETRGIDSDLVAAQETRRVLDRLVGWELTGVLWKKVAPKLSAGRVQSVATRLVVERERELMAFRTGRFWDVVGTFAVPGDVLPQQSGFEARLEIIDGKGVAQAKDFDSATGAIREGVDVVVLDESSAHDLAQRVTDLDFVVTQAKRSAWSRRPEAPFVTSTLQQSAGRKLRSSPSNTMRLAQHLYEEGYITYMRTDSTELSDEAVNAARKEIRERWGESYLAVRPRRYGAKARHAQQAHEAIRPAGARFRDPRDVVGRVGEQAARLYELIWRRTVASQMADARGQKVSVRIEGDAADGEHLVFYAQGRTTTFPGFLQMYAQGTDEPARQRTFAEGEAPLSELVQGGMLTCIAGQEYGHETKPPPRYTEPSLVGELTRRGIGRPSTYATVVRTIGDRGYVRNQQDFLVPTWTAMVVTQLLERHFSTYVDYDFTAQMEATLDEIAAGERDPTPWLAEVYFGADGTGGLRGQVREQLDKIDARVLSVVAITPPDSDESIEVRVGRYGPYVERDGRSVSVPESVAPSELTLGQIEALFVLPRALGTDSDGVEVTVRTGRYGPYLERGKDTRSVDGAAALTIGLDEALALLAEPKPQRSSVARKGGRKGGGSKGGRGRVLADLGPHPQSGKTLTVTNGRYGPYVTDGTTNASIPKGTLAEEVTIDGAVELLRRQQQRSGRRGGRGHGRARRGGSSRR